MTKVSTSKAASWSRDLTKKLWVSLSAIALVLTFGVYLIGAKAYAEPTDPAPGGGGCPT